MGIVSGIASLMAPLITITIQFMTAFVILIWFTLSIIYAIVEIINFLLGQPFVGWLLTGNINSTNDVRHLFSNNLFSFNSPIMIFLYIGLCVSLFMFLIYFIWGALQKEPFGISYRLIGISLILLSVIWMPFLYSILTLATSGLMLGLNSLLNLSNSTNWVNSLDPKTLKVELLKNLQTLKQLKIDFGFNRVDLESKVVVDWINQHLSSSEASSFGFFVEKWNEWLATLTNEQIDEWINVIESINLDNLDSITQEQANVLNKLGNFSLSLNSLNLYYQELLRKITNDSSLEAFNNIFLTTTNSSTDFKNFFMDEEIFNLNNLDNQNNKINDWCFFVINNKIVYSNNFSQNLVNILYSLALGRNAIFVAGWNSSNVIGQSWDLFWIIPAELKMPIANVSVYLFYNIKVIAIGTIINSFLLSSIVAFVLILLKRFLFLTYWPIKMLFMLSRTGSGDMSFARQGIGELFFKFVNIVIFGVLWNLITFLTTAIFNALNSINSKFNTSSSSLFDGQIWIVEVLKLLIIVGIIFCSILLIREFLEKMEEDRNMASAGAAEASRASGALKSEMRKVKQNVNSATKKSASNLNRKTKNWRNSGYSAYSSSRSKGFGIKDSVLNAARAMFSFRRQKNKELK